MAKISRFLALFLLAAAMPVPAVSAAAARDAKLYYESGALKGEFPYHDGKLDGTVKWYYESGALGALMDYRKNRLHGFTWTFYENGRLRKVVRLEDNRPVGHAKYFAENGALTEIQHHAGGKAVSRWIHGADGRVASCEEIGSISSPDDSHGL